VQQILLIAIFRYEVDEMVSLINLVDFDNIEMLECSECLDLVIEELLFDFCFYIVEIHNLQSDRCPILYVGS
jgi:hypothetical protein